MADNRPTDAQDQEKNHIGFASKLELQSYVEQLSQRYIDERISRWGRFLGIANIGVLVVAVAWIFFYIPYLTSHEVAAELAQKRGQVDKIAEDTRELNKRLGSRETQLKISEKQLEAIQQTLNDLRDVVNQLQAIDREHLVSVLREVHQHPDATKTLESVNAIRRKLMAGELELSCRRLVVTDQTGSNRIDISVDAKDSAYVKVLDENSKRLMQFGQIHWDDSAPEHGLVVYNTKNDDVAAGYYTVTNEGETAFSSTTIIAANSVSAPKMVVLDDKSKERISLRTDDDLARLIIKDDNGSQLVTLGQIRVSDNNRIDHSLTLWPQWQDTKQSATWAVDLGVRPDSTPYFVLKDNEGARWSATLSK